MNSIGLATFLQALLLCCSLIQGWKTNYCDKKLCKDDQVHTACNNRGKLGKACRGDVKVIEMTKELQDQIVERHNFYRNEVARGGLERFPKAGEMEYMLWNDELAYIASLHSLKCEYAHDVCRRTMEFPKAGQNIGRIQANHKSKIVPSIDKMIYSWFEEHELSNPEQIMEHKKINGTGHFTTLVTDDSNRVGCGMIAFETDYKYKYTLLLVCNYARGNVNGRPVYKSGDVAGSECEEGTDHHFRALCTPDES